MPSRRVMITAGVLAVAAGATAIAAHSYRGEGHGWRDGGRHGGWRQARSITKDDFDAQTRSRFAKMDANGDGVVVADEAKALMERRKSRWRKRRSGRRMERRMSRMLRRFDRDNDKSVSREEFDQRMSQMFARMDLDGDERITDADLPPMMRGRNILSGKSAHSGRWHRGRRGPARMLRRLRGADANGDGEVSKSEALAVTDARFKRWDRNGDGKVNRADFEALQAEMADYRVKRFFHRYGASGKNELTLGAFKAERDRRFAERDRNNDNVLSGRELRGRWAHRGGHHGRGREAEGRHHRGMGHRGMMGMDRHGEHGERDDDDDDRGRGRGEQRGGAGEERRL